MKNFTIEDFSGSGQYLVKICPHQQKQREEGKGFHLSNTGFLSTIMYKVGYMHGKENNPSSTCMIAMSDGWTTNGYFNTHNSKDIQDWEFIYWKTKQEFCDYLNNEPHGEEYRFATIEEVIRVVLYQRNYKIKE